MGTTTDPILTVAVWIPKSGFVKDSPGEMLNVEKADLVISCEQGSVCNKLTSRGRQIPTEGRPHLP